MDTVMVSFDTNVKQMTEMFQLTQCLSEKKQGIPALGGKQRRVRFQFVANNHFLNNL